jgi:hypothetical protein
MHAAIDTASDQPRGFQHADVPGNRRQRHVERFGKLGDLRRPVGQPGQQSTPRPITQRVEHSV